MVRALAYTFFTSGTDIWVQIGRSKSGHLRLSAGGLGCRDKAEGKRQSALEAAPYNLKPYSSFQSQENSEVRLMVSRVYK